MKKNKLHNFFQHSLCRGQYLHRFSVKEEYPEGVKEVCEICGLSKFFRIIDGKVNNYDYMGWHYRQAIPPMHPYYYHEREFNPLQNNLISPYVE